MLTNISKIHRNPFMGKKVTEDLPNAGFNYKSDAKSKYLQKKLDDSNASKVKYFSRVKTCLGVGFIYIVDFFG